MMGWIKQWTDTAARAFAAPFRPAPANRPPLGFDVAILSYDRPAYLWQVLCSLRPQLTRQDRVTLFQDGHIDRHSGQTIASDKDIAACMAMFRKLFPAGQIVHAPDNLGIALNYERAERHVFETHGAEAGLFLEDDLVLSPNFLPVTSALLGMAQANPRIAYVSACGNLWASREEQTKRAGELMPMHENWGAAMTRQSWLAERPFRQAYLDLVRGTAYARRNHERIVAFYAARGWTCRFTSQDAARWIASIERNAARISSFACHARYIGEHGAHFTPDLFEKGGFSKTVMFEGKAPELSPPDEEFLDRCIEDERRRFTGAGMPFYPSHGS